MYEECLEMIGNWSGFMGGSNSGVFFAGLLLVGIVMIIVLVVMLSRNSRGKPK